MTCIVAVKTSEGFVVLGADSAGVCGNFYQIRSDPKLYKIGIPLGETTTKVKFGYGFTGSYSLGQLLRYWIPCTLVDNESATHYMITKYSPGVRQLLKDSGRLVINDGEEKSPGQLLVALEGNIYRVESDFQVAEFYLPFACAGLGEDPALGFLYAHYKNGDLLSVEETIPLVEGALEASSAFCQAIKPPWTTLVI